MNATIIIVNSDYIQDYIANKEQVRNIFNNITSAFLEIGNVIPEMILLACATEYILTYSGDPNYVKLWDNAPETLHVLAGANPDLLDDVTLYLKPIVERDRKSWLQPLLN